MRFFQSLVRGVNRAWGTHEYTWWRLPIQNMLMVLLLASALLLGIVVPLTLDSIESLLSRLKLDFGFGLIVVTFDTLRFIVPAGVLFYGFSMFYKLAPQRRTTFREVWMGALVVTVPPPVAAVPLCALCEKCRPFSALCMAPLAASSR